jgi:hypothetical protein
VHLIHEVSEERFGFLSVSFNDDGFEVVGDGGEIDGRGRVVRLLWRLKRDLGLLGAEVVESRLGEAVFAAFG